VYLVHLVHACCDESDESPRSGKWLVRSRLLGYQMSTELDLMRLSLQQHGLFLLRLLKNVKHDFDRKLVGLLHNFFSNDSQYP